MKRAACFLLVALMLAVGGASAVEKDYAAMLERQKAEGLLHLWDIPFGITMDEFKNLGNEATGFVFEEITLKDSDGPDRYSMRNYQNDEMAPRISGYIVEEVTGYFDDTFEERENMLMDKMQVSWRINRDATSEYVIAMFADLTEKLTQRYGEATTVGFRVNNTGGQEEEWIPCVLKDENGEYQWEDAKSALDSGMDIQLFVGLGNGELHLLCSQISTRLICSISFLVFDAPTDNYQLYEDGIPYAEMLEMKKPRSIDF